MPRRLLAYLLGVLPAVSILACAGANGSPAPERDAATGLDAAAEAHDAGPASTGSVEFAPYFPAWTFATNGYAYTSLVDLQQKAAIHDVTLAFVLASPDGGCASDLASDGIAQNLADIHAFVDAGGHAKVSFGGSQGLYLQDPSACATAADLAGAIGSVVDTTGISDLDSDVEQPFNSGMSDTANTNLGQALHSLQQNRDIQVGLTLQHSMSGSLADDGGAAGDGLDPTAVTLIQEVVAAGARIRHVNVMVMGYGPLPTNTTESGRAIATLNAAQGQVKALIPGLTDAQAWAMLGVTPEIGDNDGTGETFAPGDATAVAQFARAHGMGLASFWSIDRDRVCTSQKCGFQKYSTVNTSDFQFANAFLAALQ